MISKAVTHWRKEKESTLPLKHTSKTESFLCCEGEISELKHTGCGEKCFYCKKKGYSERCPPKTGIPHHKHGNLLEFIILIVLNRAKYI